MKIDEIKSVIEDARMRALEDGNDAYERFLSEYVSILGTVPSLVEAPQDGWVLLDDEICRVEWKEEHHAYWRQYDCEWQTDTYEIYQTEQDAKIARAVAWLQTAFLFLNMCRQQPKSPASAPKKEEPTSNPWEGEDLLE